MPYRLIWEDLIPYSICGNIITPETELVSALSIYRSEKKRNHHSAYEHFLLCCEHLGIPGMKEFLDYLLAFDFLIANTDRHLGNFGAIRNVDTLEWVGPAPVYDSGTSLWHDKITGAIHPESDVSCHPFSATHGQQIGLAGNLDWIDFSALQDIDEEFRVLLLSSPYIDEPRKDALCRGLKGRVQQLEQLALQQDFKELSQEEPELESLVLK